MSRLETALLIKAKILTQILKFNLGVLGFWGFGVLGKGSKNVLVSTHVVEQLSFCMFPSFLIFDFHLFLGSFFTF